MKTNATQQEILLTTNSSFARREWTEITEAGSASYSYKEEFEKACWNGLVKELLPEIDAETTIGKTLALADPGNKIFPGA